MPEIRLIPDSVPVQLKSGLVFSTRVAQSADLRFLNQLYTANMKVHVERHGRWDPGMFASTFEPSAIEVIEVGGEIAGFVKLIPEYDAIYLAELQIDGRYQGKGIGGTLLERLLAYARGRDEIITLKVLRGNPAEFLYRRYGFRLYKTTALHFHLSSYPAGGR